jgi:Carboxypeptidase regulatory-like domain/TonB dependent receptor
MRSSLRSVLAAALIFSLSALGAHAQEHRASIRGVVVDPSLKGISNVDVRASREETGESRGVKTDEGGRFTLPELPPGIYRVNVEQPGFGPFVARVELAMNQEYWLQVPLQLGTVQQAVDVTAPFIPVDRDTPAVHTFIDERTITELPLDGRNFLELALLAPGTVPPPQGSASTGRGDFALSINGAREDFNGFLLDGVYNIDPKLNTPGVRPPIDGIHQFQVFTSTYDASFGRNAGGQINVITKSGANRFSGSAYEFFRNGALNSRNHFAPKDVPAPDYNRHQFGGSLGGPLVAGRAFFFGDYEHSYLREGITRVTNVPTLAERNGDFSQTLFNRPINFLIGQPFPGDVIPAFFQSPIGRSIAALYPLPNRNQPFANYVSSPTLRDDVDQADLRVDQSFTGGSRLTGRYSLSDRRLSDPFAGPGFALVPGFGTNVPRRGQNVGLTFTHTPGGRIVNDVRFGYNRVSIGVFAENTQVNNASVGLKPFGSNPRDAGLSVISVAGYSPLGHEYTTPQESTSDTFQLSDTATLSRGHHLLKGGAEWYGIRQSAYRDVQSRGFLTFVSQGYTGNALADLLLGLPVITGGAHLDNPQELRGYSWSLFAQDDWRPTSSLTVSAGLRYDYIAPPVDADNRANLYDPSSGQLVPVGTGNMPRGGYVPDRNNLAPRVGFAWALGPEGKNVLRGGYGIYYNQGALATSEGLYFNPPYFNLGVYFPGAGNAPTLSDPFPSDFPVYIPQSATAFQRDLQTPSIEQWNVNVQHMIGFTRSIEVGYVGSRGHSLISARDANQPPASPNPVNLRPNPLFADVTLIESRGSSRFNSLQIRYQERPSVGTMILASYTLGKSTDDASGFFTSAGDPNFPQNSLDPGAEEGPSSFDVRHRFTAALIRPLPFAPHQLLGDLGWFSKIFRDTDFEMTASMQSGRPFTVMLLPDIDNSNTGRSNLGFGFNDRPNVSGSTSVSSPGAAEWFNTKAFSMPPFGSFGNSGRNTLRGPGYANLNVALVKHLRYGTRAQVDLRAEGFNITNRTNYDLPDPFFGSPTFGQILSAGSPRRFQFGVRTTF